MTATARESMPTGDRGPLTRYVHGDRSPLATEAKRRYERSRALRALTTVECEERPLDDQRDFQVNVVVGDVVHSTQDRALAIAMLRAHRELSAL